MWCVYELFAAHHVPDTDRFDTPCLVSNSHTLPNTCLLLSRIAVSALHHESRIQARPVPTSLCVLLDPRFYVVQDLEVRVALAHYLRLPTISVSLRSQSPAPFFFNVSFSSYSRGRILLRCREKIYTPMAIYRTTLRYNPTL